MVKLISLCKIIAAVVLIGLMVSFPTSGNRACQIKIINANGGPVLLHAEIADTERLRVKGLMHRNNLGINNGMLFIFDSERLHQFWMKNTYIPLSIAFIGKNGIITEIFDMEPLDTTFTSPTLPSLYALETNRGWFQKNNIAKGCKILLDGCFGK
jgi:uncharacterized membrane protein (UPF0127 family)